jgi:hypothetical protein
VKWKTTGGKTSKKNKEILMLRRISILILTCLATRLVVAQVQSCSDYGIAYDGAEWAPTGSAEHKTDYHSATGYLNGACSYESISQPNCGTISTTTADYVASVDLGTLTSENFFYYHQTTSAGAGGTGFSNGGTAQSGGTLAATANSCLISCSLSISISATSNGVGATVSFPPNNLDWAPLTTATTNCIAEPDPQYGTCGDGGTCYGGGGGGDDPDCPPDDITTGGSSSNTCISPILIDTTGKGFHLTSLADGVRFDMLGDGHPIPIAWPAADSGNALLALDRNGNGKIDSGKELFGNLTAQPHSANPNGYLALAEFDKPENGGNGDGIIDSRDAVFPHLLLWIDANHDGISQPEELHSLPELGVYSIGLTYHDDHYFDQFGNWFHYTGILNPDAKDGESHDGRRTFDVWLEAHLPSSSSSSQSPLTEIKAGDTERPNITETDHRPN